jgi:hypothetical protein
MAIFCKLVHHQSTVPHVEHFHLDAKGTLLSTPFSLTFDTFSLMNSTIGSGKGALAMSVVSTEHAVADAAVVLSSAQLSSSMVHGTMAKAIKTTRKKEPMRPFHSNRNSSTACICILPCTNRHFAKSRPTASMPTTPATVARRNKNENHQQSNKQTN